MTNFQRIGSISNAHAGREFEADAQEYFHRVEGLQLRPSLSLDLGVVGAKPKAHRFDLGSHDPAVLVECKSHNWTVTGNMPSAKVTVWNEAMYYFYLAPENFRKILFVLESHHPDKPKTLAQYYTQINAHLIPIDVSIFEYNPITKSGHYVKVAG